MLWVDSFDGVRNRLRDLGQEIEGIGHLAVAGRPGEEFFVPRSGKAAYGVVLRLAPSPQIVKVNDLVWRPLGAGPDPTADSKRGSGHHFAFECSEYSASIWPTMVLMNRSASCSLEYSHSAHDPFHSNRPSDVIWG